MRFQYFPPCRFTGASFLDFNTKFSQLFKKKIKALLTFTLLTLFQTSSLYSQLLVDKSVGNSLATSNDNWAIFNNPSGALWTNKSFISAYYFLHPFIDELDYKTVGVAYRKSNKLFASSLFQQGDQRLNIREISLSYGQLFGNLLSLASTVHFRNYAFGDIYGQRSLLFLSFGGQIKLNKLEEIGFYIKNPSNQHIDRRNNERLESSFSFAYLHRFSKLFDVSLGLEKQSTTESNFRLFWKYKISNRFQLIGGYESLFRRYNLGTEIIIKDLTLLQSINYDVISGIQLGFGLSYNLSKRNEEISTPDI